MHSFGVSHMQVVVSFEAEVYYNNPPTLVNMFASNWGPHFPHPQGTSENRKKNTRNIRIPSWPRGSCSKLNAHNRLWSGDAILMFRSQGIGLHMIHFLSGATWPRQEMVPEMVGFWVVYCWWMSWFAEIIAPNCYGFHVIWFYRILISTRTSEAICHQRYDCIWCGSPTCQVTSNWINASCCLPMRCFKVPHRLALIFKNVETCWQVGRIISLSFMEYV